MPGECTVGPFGQMILVSSQSVVPVPATPASSPAVTTAKAVSGCFGVGVAAIIATSRGSHLLVGECVAHGVLLPFQVTK